MNTSGIIIVEGVRLFWRGEPSVISLATELQAVVSSSPTPPSALCQHLTTHLRLKILMMPVCLKNQTLIGHIDNHYVYYKGYIKVLLQLNKMVSYSFVFLFFLLTEFLFPCFSSLVMKKLSRKQQTFMVSL